MSVSFFSFFDIRTPFAVSRGCSDNCHCWASYVAEGVVKRSFFFVRSVVAIAVYQTNNCGGNDETTEAMR